MRGEKKKKKKRIHFPRVTHFKLLSHMLGNKMAMIFISLIGQFSRGSPVTGFQSP
jgi:hypothetical protein